MNKDTFSFSIISSSRKGGYFYEWNTCILQTRNEYVL